MEIARRSSIQVREVWPHETDFSNWLVSEDGLATIAEDIGVLVEDAQRECRPGDFSCDIVARVQGEEDHIVVIENQFGKTNHDHLGKLITYASVNNATTAIWISENISDDHRKAVDWLNENTPVHINFYLAQIQAYRITQSPVAPQLTVVCRPNLQVKVSREKASLQENSSHQWYRTFWEEVLDHIRTQSPPFSVRNTSADHWVGIGVGRSGFSLSLSVAAKRTRLCCEIAIDAKWRLSAFDQLHQQKNVVEQELGCPLEWLRLEDKKISRIKLHADINPSDPENMLQVKQWMSDTSAAFYRAFRERIQNLSSDLPYEEDAEDEQSQ